MKKILILLLMAVGAQAQPSPSAEIQIKVALLACPEESRDHAMVYGYSPKGEFIVLRTGTNEMVCIADDPASPGLSVSCYHKSLEPFMERGRVLKKQGKNYQEIFDIREQEAKIGKLILPKQPASLVVLSAAAEDYSITTGEVRNSYSRSVVYIPFATAESTGLPSKPTTPGMPWIMNPGTARAHIMIDPPRKN